MSEVPGWVSAAPSVKGPGPLYYGEIQKGKTPAGQQVYSDSDVGTPATETWHLTSPPRVTDVGTPHHGPTTADLAPSITARRQ